MPDAVESGVHVAAVGARVAGEQLEVAQVGRVRGAREARVVRAVLRRVGPIFSRACFTTRSTILLSQFIALSSSDLKVRTLKELQKD